MAISNIIVGIDIDVSKVSIVVAEINDYDEPEVIATALHKGHFFDEVGNLNRLELTKSLSYVIKRAEDISKLKIKSCYVTFPGKYADVIQTEIKRDTKDKYSGVTENDIYACIDQGRNHEVKKGYYVVEVVPYNFLLDDGTTVIDPIGRFSNVITMRAQIVSMDIEYMDMLLDIFTKLNVEVEGFEPIMFTEQPLILDSRDLKGNLMLVDFGRYTVEVGIYVKGALIYTETIPFGSINVSYEISRRLEISYEEADKLQKQYNLALKSYIENDNNILLSTTKSTDIRKRKIKTSDLIGIIEDKYREMFEYINKDIEVKGLKRYIRNIILTGEGVLGVHQTDTLALIIFSLPVKLVPPKLADTVKYVHMRSFGLVQYVSSNPYILDMNDDTSTQQQNKSALKIILEKIRDFFYS